MTVTPAAVDLTRLDAVLVPIDFSDLSIGALRAALSLAPPERIHVAHVLPVAGGLSWAVSGAGNYESRVEGAKARLLRELTDDGIAAEVIGRLPVHVRVGAA